MRPTAHWLKPHSAFHVVRITATHYLVPCEWQNVTESVTVFFFIDTIGAPQQPVPVRGYFPGIVPGFTRLVFLTPEQPTLPTPHCV
ncbi:MAG: hypothetical protein AAF653_10590 [Chloroflexota bacterium]